jgi:hypothetical protein
MNTGNLSLTNLNVTLYENSTLTHHLINNDIPFIKIDEYDVSGMSINNNHIVATNGSVIFVTEYGIVRETINTFLNKLFFEMHIDREEWNVGENTTIIINTDGMLSIDTDLPYTIDGNKINIEFDRRGEHNLTLVAQKEGYESIEKIITFLVKEFVTLSIEAKSTTSTISIPFILEIDGERKELLTPYTDIIEAQTINLTFPNSYENLDFQRIIINGKSIIENKLSIDIFNDTSIITTYGRNIIINVEDAEGSGSYPIGAMVTLSADDKEIIPFILKEKFDHWEGLSNTLNNKSNPLIFRAEESMNIRAVYKIDYTGLTIPMAVIATIAILKIKKRRKDVT